jgi:hypothetical protein
MASSSFSWGGSIPSGVDSGSSPVRQRFVERQIADQPSKDYLGFERLTSALFRVDKRDVPKHERKKRNSGAQFHPKSA